MKGFGYLVGWVLFLSNCVAGAQSVSPPRSFEAYAFSPSEIRCFWLPASGATGYRLERDGQLLTTLPPTTTEYADTNLAPDSTHRYRLVALKEESASPAREYVERSFAPFPAGKGNRGTASFDVVVVQASSGGVTAAIEAARRGAKVALIEPTTRLGGMPVNGLSATDLRRDARASGFLVRFRNRVRDLYASEGVKADGLRYEPRIAHQAMKSLIYEVPNLTIYRRARLKSVRTVASAGQYGMLASTNARKRVTTITVEELDTNGKPTGKVAELAAKVFIDSTDSGDLAAWAGAPFRYGREPRSKEEPHNGVIYYDRKAGLPLPGSTGQGDKRMQAYAYLLTVKDYGPNADKTIPRPPSYRKEDFTQSPDWKSSWAFTDGRLPQGKYELNQHPQGGDLQEVNYNYPTGDYRERARVDALYRERVLSYLYYIQTELGQKQLGLPDDEYRDSNGFPPLLYVREGRRILGEQLPVEADITNARQIVRPESIGLGDYPMDSHAVRVKRDTDPRHMGEGEWWLYQKTPWYEVPLGVMVPQRLDNVFVTTAVSSTHVSFGTFRMEPVRMAFGQAAGIAATLCLRYNLAAREVPAAQIQQELLNHPANPVGERGVQLYHFPDLSFDHPNYRAIQYLAARGFLPDGENFAPNASTTHAELGRWLILLAGRGTPAYLNPREFPLLEKQAGGKLRIRRDKSLFPQEDTQFLPALTLATGTNPQQPVSRAEFAANLFRVLTPKYTPPTPKPEAIYADLTEVDLFWVEALARSYGIDSRLWDDWHVYAPNGKLLFRPNQPITHAEAFAALYIAQIGLGPLFFDNPVDGLNGRTIVKITPE